MLAMGLANRAKAANVRKLFLLLCATAYKGPAKLFRDLKKRGRNERNWYLTTPKSHDMPNQPLQFAKSRNIC